MPKTITTKCLICQSDTNQKVLFSKIVIEHQDDDAYKDSETTEDTNYMTIQCAGCNTISFVKRMTVKDNKDENDSHFSIDENYPETNGEFYNFLTDDEKRMLPKLLYKLYDEVISAFDTDSEILAGLGLRTLVEAICIEQKISGANLQKKIINLKEQGLISNNETPILDKLRLIGNFAAHEIKGLPLDILSYALDIVNHVLKSIYILPKINRKIKI